MTNRAKPRRRLVVPYHRKGLGKDRFGKCRQCGARIQFDTDRHGHHVAVNDNGTSHPCEGA